VERTRDLGQPPEGRAFTGHLTLARVSGRPPKALVGERISASFTVDAVHVVSSHLGQGPARYETEATIPL
jgi:2'-5' RNA ligase